MEKKLFCAPKRKFLCAEQDSSISGIENRQIDDDEDDGSVGENDSVLSNGNHIYFFSFICRESILLLVRKIRRLEKQLRMFAIEWDIFPPPIVIHINSPGGVATDGFFGYDAIKNCKVTIHTIVEGECCSAATFLSVAGEKRYITQNSVMLIHQISTGYYGNITGLEDEMENCKLLMKKLSTIYRKHSKLPEKKLQEILKHDLYFDSSTCLKYGLVDKILDGGSEK